MRLSNSALAVRVAYTTSDVMCAGDSEERVK